MSRRNVLSGFTLIEMLVVLVIIGLLASLVGPRLFSTVDSSKVDTAKVQIERLRGGLDMMHLHIDRFPTPAEGLALLNTPPADEKTRARWRGPYMGDEIPMDPWGNPYQYGVPGANGKPFALYSLGADGKRGGEGNDADIGILPPQ